MSEKGPKFSRGYTKPAEKIEENKSGKETGAIKENLPEKGEELVVPETKAIIPESEKEFLNRSNLEEEEVLRQKQVLEDMFSNRINKPESKNLKEIKTMIVPLEKELKKVQIERQKITEKIMLSLKPIWNPRAMLGFVLAELDAIKSLLSRSIFTKKGREELITKMNQDLIKFLPEEREQFLDYLAKEGILEDNITTLKVRLLELENLEEK